MRLARASTWWISVLILTTQGSDAGARQFPYNRVADTTTQVPDGAGVFTRSEGRAFGFVNISHDRVAFGGHNVEGWGVYEYVGTGSLIVRDGMAIPAGNGEAFNFGPFAPATRSDGADIVFRGYGQARSGVYSRFGSALGVVADSTMTPPGASGPFVQFGETISLSGRRTAFGATTGISNLPGIYVAQAKEGIITIADTTTQIPGGHGLFTNLGNPELAGGQTYFSGGRFTSQSNYFGVFRGTGTGVSKVVATGDPEPRGLGLFNGPGLLSAEGSSVLFQSVYGSDSARGLYRITGDTINFMADTNTHAPGTTSNFRAFSSGDIRDDKVVFLDGQLNSVFTDARGVLEKVVGAGDIVDGKTVREVLYSRGRFDGDQAAVHLIFTTDTFMNPDQGVYVFTIPSPHSAAVVGVFGVVACRRRGASART